jgi:hypothetical protein
MKKLIQINEMPGDQLKGDTIRYLLHELELANREMKSIINSAK